MVVKNLYLHRFVSSFLRRSNKAVFILVCLIAASVNATAQKRDSLVRNVQQADTANKIKITIANSENFISTKTDSGEYNKFITNVVLYQGTDTLYCDSLYQNSATKNFEAFGDVKVAQMGGTHGTSDYLRYTTNTKLAYMRGNVKLTDGKNDLFCQELTYNLATKIAVYENWGQLHNDSTTVTSKTGVYNSANKTARFTGQALVSDPQYNIKSEDLLYHTETKVTEFYAPSVVTRDNGKSILQTKEGTYDGIHGIAHFLSHSSIWNDGQYIEGDSLYYNKQLSYGLANGNVIAIDTEHHSVLFCGHAEYFTRRRVMWATIKPVLLQVNGKDSLYMRADTFYSAPMEKLVPKVAKIKSQRKNLDTATSGILVIKGLPARDSAAPKDSLSLNNHIAKRDTTVKGDTLPYPPADSLSQVAMSKQDTLRGVVANAKPITKNGMASKHTIKNKTTKAKPAKQPTTTQNKKAKVNSTAREAKVKSLYKVPDVRATDTAAADTTAPLYFIGYHHVLIFSDSLQGKCDSVCYTRSDSTIRMMYKPIVWAHNSQVNGDTILLRLDSSRLKSMYVPNNAFMVSQSGPAKAGLFDQVQGKTLTAFFEDNNINRIYVYPDAQSIYYSIDEKGYYLGVAQANADTMRVYFKNKKLIRIKMLPEVHETMTPMEKADLPGMKLSRFKWLIADRPKSKEELFK
jgi:lipopolysaccharide export system protein LptA